MTARTNPSSKGSTGNDWPLLRTIRCTPNRAEREASSSAGRLPSSRYRLTASLASRRTSTGRQRSRSILGRCDCSLSSAPKPLQPGVDAGRRTGTAPPERSVTRVEAAWPVEDPYRALRATSRAGYRAPSPPRQPPRLWNGSCRPGPKSAQAEPAGALTPASFRLRCSRFAPSRRWPTGWTLRRCAGRRRGRSPRQHSGPTGRAAPLIAAGLDRAKSRARRRRSTGERTVQGGTRRRAGQARRNRRQPPEEDPQPHHRPRRRRGLAVALGVTTATPALASHNSWAG